MTLILAIDVIPVVENLLDRFGTRISDNVVNFIFYVKLFTRFIFTNFNKSSLLQHVLQTFYPSSLLWNVTATEEYASTAYGHPSARVKRERMYVDIN